MALLSLTPLTFINVLPLLLLGLANIMVVEIAKYSFVKR